jgi:hypothetical protein
MADFMPTLPDVTSVAKPRRSGFVSVAGWGRDHTASGVPPEARELISWAAALLNVVAATVPMFPFAVQIAPEIGTMNVAPRTRRPLRI